MKLTWNEEAYKIPDDLGATYTWGQGADYAAAVYFGLNGPARPWADYVIDDEDILEDLLLQSIEPDNFTDTFVNFAYSLGFAFQDAMEAPIWYWPNNTLRSSGEIVGSPRDIVDTGRLRDSQTIDFTGV